MKFIWGILSLFVLCNSVIVDEEMVLVLNDSNFKEAITTHENLLVEFYAPWCGHCKKLAPEYASAAKILRGEKPPLYIAKVDATQSKELAKEYGIRGFPTLKFFKNGVSTDYESGRSSSDIVSFMKKKSGPIAVTFATVDSLKATIDAEETTIVGYFASTSLKEYDVWLKAVSSLDDAKIVYITDKTIMAKMNAKEGSVYLYKTMKSVVKFEGKDFGTSDFKKWVAVNELPLIIPFSTKWSRKLFLPDHEISTQLMFFAPENNPGTIKKTMESLASKYMGKAFVVHVPSENTRLMEYFGLTADKLPSVVLCDFSEDGSMKKYLFTEQKTEANLSRFVDNFFGGILTPFYKSDPIPATQDEPVYKLVGKSFESVVYDINKNVFVKFYAPWCGHCKQLAPMWIQLAEHFSKNGNVIIADMDSTANEVEGLEIRGFPTLKFWRAGDAKNESVEFDGDRNLAALIEFVNKNMVPKEAELDL